MSDGTWTIVRLFGSALIHIGVFVRPNDERVVGADSSTQAAATVIAPR
jgi:hypothetical protein